MIFDRFLPASRLCCYFLVALMKLTPASHGILSLRLSFCPPCFQHAAHLPSLNSILRSTSNRTLRHTVLGLLEAGLEPTFKAFLSISTGLHFWTSNRVPNIELHFWRVSKRNATQNGCYFLSAPEHHLSVGRALFSKYPKTGQFTLAENFADCGCMGAVEAVSPGSAGPR